MLSSVSSCIENDSFLNANLSTKPRKKEQKEKKCFTYYVLPFKVPAECPLTRWELWFCLPQSVAQMKSRMCDLLQHYGDRTWLICWRPIAHFQIPAPWRSYELSSRDRCVLPADSEDVSGVFTGTLKRALALSMARQWPVLKGRLRFCCATILRSCSRGCWHTCWSTGILRWFRSYWKIRTSILLHLNCLMLEKMSLLKISATLLLNPACSFCMLCQHCMAAELL